MSGVPPALATNVGFTPDYWSKIRRDMTKAKIVRITNRDEGWVELAFQSEGKPELAFQRKVADLDPAIKLHANLEVFIQTVKGTLVTGLWVPAVGWAFQLTNEQLAQQAQDYAAKLHMARVEHLRLNRELFEDTEASLPDWLKARIENFRSQNKATFELEGWEYELIVAKLAEGLDADMDADEFKALAREYNASENQVRCAMALAAGRRQYGDEYALAVPAAMSPLTGKPDYSH